jgi:membrane protease YdiL (CAAX protease family)
MSVPTSTSRVPAAATDGSPRPDLLTRARQSAAARPLAWFFAWAFVLSWATWPIVLATGAGPPVLGFGPFLAAVLVLALGEGGHGVLRLLQAMVRWRVPWQWWATALLLPVLLTAAAAGLNVALGAPAPTAADLGRWPDAALTAVLILCVPFIGGAWEEPGWRGFALPRLLGRFSPLAASVLLGAVWAAWHLPVLVSGDQHWSDLLLVVLASVVFTWVFGNARASVLIAMVMHAMNNAVSGEYVSPMFTGADSTRQSWLLVVVWGVTAVAVAVGVRGFRRTP